MNDKPRGVVNEYWLERRRARLQARRRGEGGPYSPQATSQGKKENKIFDPWAWIWDNNINNARQDADFFVLDCFIIGIDTE